MRTEVNRLSVRLLTRALVTLVLVNSRRFPGNIVGATTSTADEEDFGRTVVTITDTTTANHQVVMSQTVFQSENQSSFLLSTLTQFTSNESDVLSSTSLFPPVSSTGETFGDNKFSWAPIPWSVWNVVETVSAVVGIVGNLLVIVVIHKRRHKKRSTDLLINALAVADFLTSLFILPVPLARTVPTNGPWGWVYCRLIFSMYFMWVCVTASIYTLVAISIERYIAIAHPIHFHSMVTKRRVNGVVCVAWLIGFLVPIPSRFVFMVGEQTNECILSYSNSTLVIFIPLFLGATRVFIPVAILVTTQLAIVNILHRQSRRFKTIASTSTTLPSFHHVAKTRLVRMMLVVMGFFVLCWSPLYIYFVLTGFQKIQLTDVVNTPIYEGLTTLGFYNSCVNPIIYTLRSTKFRAAVRDMFKHASDGKSDSSELF
ncbi:adenosine receptor A2b-like [Diadema setosum]|uniref:adenosine receptor A2b-like n=1 Tax=Diadema setosum TaxID=31175 RepID=UPI003B3A41DC